MVVTVQYITTARQITKKRSEQIALSENATVQDLINKLVETYGTALRKVMVPQGKSLAGVFVGNLIKGEALQPAETLDTELHEETTILIGTVVVGG